MKILIISPRIYDFTAFNYWLYPMFELVLADFLIKKGNEVNYINFVDYEKPRKRDKYGKSPLTAQDIKKPDGFEHIDKNYNCFGKDIETIKNELKETDPPDQVIIFLKMTYWYQGIVEARDIIKEIFPAARIYIGGNVALLIKDFLEKKYEFEIYNEDLEKDLEDLNPLHNLFLDKQNPHFFSSITSYGCSVSCPYCINSLDLAGKHKNVQRKPENIINEILSTCMKYRIRDVSFYDDAILDNPNILLILSELKIIIPDLRFHFPNGLSLEKMLENAPAFKRLGVTSFAVGYEWGGCTKSSGNILEYLFVECEKLGFDKRYCGANFMIGIPGQTFEEAKKDLEYLLNTCRGYRIKINEYSPVPGTQWAEKHKKDCIDGVDFESEPLWQNNSLLGYRSKEFTIDRIRELKNMIR